MKNILLYIEAHPLRDSYEEFYSVGGFLGNILYEKAADFKFNLRLFSNNHVVDRLVSEQPNLSTLCIRPTVAESAEIEGYARGWDESSIQEWLELTRGQGAASHTYYNILERIFGFYKFDLVLLWAENGAVRKFCEAHNIAVVHGELGPTRPPFEETIYFDAKGTNGNASITKFPENLYEKVDIVPPETWICTKGAKENDPKKKGIIDSPYTLVVDEYSLATQTPYVYIPLQLADDLNTLQHSAFKGPVDFLEKVVPRILDQGYGVVIKPHPGSISRAHNLSLESRALKMVKAYGERVIVLDRAVNTTRALNFMVHADAVCTINSSVGYEALLMGKKVFLMGDAAYDVGGHLKASLDDISRIDSYEVDPSLRDRLVSLMSGHYLFPKSELVSGDTLFRILKFHFENRIDHGSTGDFWSAWLSNFRPGYDLIIRRIASKFELANIVGSVEYLKSQKAEILEENGTVVFFGKLGRDDISVQAQIDETAFFGFIDKIVYGENKKAKIIGWALDKNLTPPVGVIVSVNGNFRSIHRLVISRRDVCESLKSSFSGKLKGTPVERCGFQFEADISENSEDVCLYLLSSENLVKKLVVREGAIHEE
ncbi:hypothetical protein thsps117_05940 [Pseudomonas sp. No.117]